MKVVYHSKYQKITHNKNSSELHFNWAPSTLQMEDQDYQKELGEALKYLTQFKPQKTLINLKQFAYTVDPDMQNWVKEHFLDCMAHQKLNNLSALVKADDFFAQKSVEQSLEDSLQENYSKYFDSKEEALDWLVG